MNYVISVIILGVLVFGYSFLPWYADSLIAFVSAGYFGIRAYRLDQLNLHNEDKSVAFLQSDWLWALISIGLGIIIILIQFRIIV